MRRKVDTYSCGERRGPRSHTANLHPGQRGDKRWSRRSSTPPLYGYLALRRSMVRYPYSDTCGFLLLQLSSTRCPGSSMFTARYGIHSEELANFFCSSSCLPAAQDISSSEACERFLLQFLSTRCPRKLSWTAGRQEMEQKKFASSAGWTPFQDLGQRVDRAGA